MSESVLIPVTVAIAGMFGTIITAIIKFVPRRLNSSMNPQLCSEHSGIVATIKAVEDGLARLEKGQNEIWEGINEIRDDVKEILQNGKKR